MRHVFTKLCKEKNWGWKILMNVESWLFLEMVFIKNLKWLLFQMHFIDILSFGLAGYLSALTAGYKAEYKENIL